MNCSRCHTYNEERAQFCKNCGMSLSVQPVTATATTPVKNDILVLLIYIGWHYLTYLIYAFINKIVVKRAGMEMINFYKALDWGISGIDVILLIVMTVILKSNAAKIAFGVFLFLRVVLFVLYRFQ